MKIIALFGGLFKPFGIRYYLINVHTTFKSYGWFKKCKSLRRNYISFKKFKKLKNKKIEKLVYKIIGYKKINKNIYQHKKVLKKCKIIIFKKVKL